MSVEVVTFGCRLNAYESDQMRTAAQSAFADDVVIINTCAVTAEAVRQARQTVRAQARANPQAQIVVTGCAAQTDPAMFANMPEVARVIGNDEKLTREVWQRSGPEKIAVGDIMRSTGIAVASAHQERARGFVQIQNGCDHRCTFCIIPFGRGNSRSLPPRGVIDQVRRLVEDGLAEVVLTGVDITSYRAADGTGLGALVKRILAEVPELHRLRLSSIDSVEADRDLLDALADGPRLMPHLHLSLQAGDDLILKRMKRRHLRADAIAFCREVRRLRPDVVFGADLIAGFPTETDEMFTRSLDLVAECELVHLHVFPFSPRPGTPAARMPQVDRVLIKERARRLRERGEAALGAHLQAQVGSHQRVL
ncbi:MAG: tRNA (N(6)-L-threonylcarbamoyladenosine(37)-C(2))-methylthiotransferase MtaB, partial [Xanthobacteraceae bacterium]|nr:tRNA (N(6)-L-threonylcarbamoyladenosine(37)-C(2))-methylthiotransferase MtaB [Xanthobacteraceae bacterium]